MVVKLVEITRLARVIEISSTHAFRKTSCDPNAVWIYQIHQEQIRWNRRLILTRWARVVRPEHAVGGSGICHETDCPRAVDERFNEKRTNKMERRDRYLQFPQTLAQLLSQLDINLAHWHLVPPYLLSCQSALGFFPQDKLACGPRLLPADDETRRRASKALHRFDFG